MRERGLVVGCIYGKLWGLGGMGISTLGFGFVVCEGRGENRIGD